ncbi:ATPase, T2SS/T4P/T4SS family [Niveispirillum cyanobacteriorum]|uniref:P-type DNA transfer ATPase VirB11 n=1 Tax=Niveispirillum cyanobacteriorum TaxID=1612173 RepID=A0A2K9NHJ4_9PROT|nr:ATPase, T2SS/T4P/T4SS family [Niveispirillum cyanobacteriorum]AUN32562.1 P-type DNA transfer ATPase VirB11 [Niveispirillum cyanobacteriorum]GGE77242.1 P-type DNA transfer ATPase VirB11 [Niveispirillum cyanobacteriorum]
MNASVAVLNDAVYLSEYLTPFQPLLGDERVTEIMVNRPGEVWAERAGRGMGCHQDPRIDDQLLRRLAEQVARLSNQGINRNQPLLSGRLPDGARVQFVAPSATRGHWAMAIRRHRLVDVPLSAYGALPPAPDDGWRGRDPMQDPAAYLADAIRARRTILVSGGTSTGKTTFLNALLRQMPEQERLVVVEDTPEITLSAPNALGLVAVKGEMGEARVTANDLLQASLRLRPDRIVLGELRGEEAVSFLRAVNTGHPGSVSTIHANSPQGALQQLALMVMQTGFNLSVQDTIAYARSVVDVIVQLDRRDGERGISAIWETAQAI